MQESMARYQRALPGALTAAGMVVVTRTQRIFVLFRPRGIASGHTYRSLTVSQPYMDNEGYMRVKVGPTTKYSWWLHFGRGPGKRPPVQNILDWVKEKNIAGSYAHTGSGTRGYPRYGRRGSRRRQEAEDLSAAFAIATAIGKHGTRPFPFLTVAFRQSRRDALRVFLRALAQGLVNG